MSTSESELEDMILYYLLQKKKKRKRTIWVTKFRTQRQEKGAFHNLIPDLTDEEYRKYIRVTRNQFEEIHSFIQGDISKKCTRFREPISTRERLAVCLRMLASGDSIRDIGFHFRIGESTISGIIAEVCEAIWIKMQPIFLCKPTREVWETKEKEFNSRWNFPHCLSSIDGKHITLQKPLKSGTSFFNYKKMHSIVLLAGVDAYYQFTFIDVGSKGRFSDGFILKNSNFGKLLIENKLDISSPRKLETNGESLPFVFVADEAFPLLFNLMRPYPGIQTKHNQTKRIYNYRLSRARQTVECAFGILAARWRIFKRPIEVHVETADKLVKAACVLHNYLRSKIRHEEELLMIDSEDFDNTDHQLIDTTPNNNSRATRIAFSIREQFKSYFVSTGSVPWQNQSIIAGRY